MSQISELQMSETVPMLEMRGITRRFPGVVALDNVNFSVRQGEIHSLIGQNGAGKSTLMKILAGIYPANEGQIFIAGQPVTIRSPREALKLGISTVYQELSLLPNLSVADNIFLGREAGSRFTINEKAVLRKAREVLDQLGVQHIAPTTPVYQLSLAQQQLVEIAKALSYQPRILVLDEPTAPLAGDDTARLFEILRLLKAQGIALIFISHRFREILQHCDRGTILRNGQLIKTIELRGVTENELIEMMIGQEVREFYRDDVPDKLDDNDLALEVERLTIGQKVQDVSFTVRRGEIVGITGLMGAGQNEVARSLFGVQEGVQGIVRRNGRVIEPGSPRAAIAQGIGLLTENRKDEGLCLELSVKENTTLPTLSRFKKWLLFIDNQREQQTAQQFLAKSNTVMRSPGAPVWTLSGGNQQKTILARWILRDLDVLVFIEPTRGVDVGAKAEIYHVLEELAHGGKSIVVISTELPEILRISDRILVMYNGRLVQNIARAAASEEMLAAAMQGTGELAGSEQ
jgi:ribose transport system ATP-binding protein